MDEELLKKDLKGRQKKIEKLKAAKNGIEMDNILANERRKKRAIDKI